MKTTAPRPKESAPAGHTHAVAQADQRPVTSAQRQMQGAIASSPRQVAQRRQAAATPTQLKATPMPSALSHAASPVGKVIQAKRDVTEAQWNTYTNNSSTRTLADGKEHYAASQKRGAKLKKNIAAWKNKTKSWWKKGSTQRTTKERKKMKNKWYSLFNREHLGKTGTGKELIKHDYETTVVAEPTYTADIYKMGTGRGSGAAKNEEDLRNSTYPADYTNSYNATSKQFSAKYNMADSDKASSEKKVLPNSEILWYQYKQALKKHNESHGPEEGMSKTGNLNSIKRSNIINNNTKDTFFLSNYGEEMMQRHERVTLDDNDEEFWTFIGTPNGTSAAYLILQHGISAGIKDVNRIESDGHDMEIIFDV